MWLLLKCAYTTAHKINSPSYDGSAIVWLLQGTQICQYANSARENHFYKIMDRFCDNFCHRLKGKWADVELHASLDPAEEQINEINHYEELESASS
jgi:hypothetical protein